MPKEEKPDATPAPQIEEPKPEPERQPPVILRVLDGDSFIRETNAQAAQNIVPTPIVVSTSTDEAGNITLDQREFLLLKAGAEIAGQIYIPQYRETGDKDGFKRWSALATAEQIVLATIQLCTVKEDATPLWQMPNLMFMYADVAQAHKYVRMLSNLHLAILELNPQLDPYENPTLLGLVAPWLLGQPRPRQRATTS